MVEVKGKVLLKCYHCGDQCKDTHIHLSDKLFCCDGCKTVYEILDKGSLCDYYSLESNPGNKVNTFQNNNTFAFLDDEKIKRSILKFQEGSISRCDFVVPSIHCSSCIWLLENLHKIHAGILSCSIHFQKKSLSIQFNDQISLRQIAELLASLGYAPSISLDGKEVNSKSVNRSLYYKLGIAGFCFGNIMMLSLPDYLSAFDEFKGGIKILFTFLSLLLAIPVFFYSASDYFISAINAVKSKVINIDLPIALGLTAAFSQSAFEILSGTGGGYMDSLTGLVFFLLIGKWYQSKTYEALSFDRDYKSYFPLAATVIIEGNERYVPINEIKPGDILLIRNQETIPADAMILEGDASIDYSFVTGESIPIDKKQGQQVFAGGKQMGQAIKLLATREVSESYLIQLWNKDNSKSKTNGLAAFTNKVGKYFTVAVIFISICTYLFWVGKDSSVAFYSAVSVLIIFCPCTLALAIPFGFGSAMNILGKQGFYLKNTQTIEKLATNDAIVFDKTGTITYNGDSNVEMEGVLSQHEKSIVKSLVSNSTHPLSRMIYQYLKDCKPEILDSYQEETARGIRGVSKGNEIKIGSASFVGSVGNSFAVKDNSTKVYVGIKGDVKACFKFNNKYRSNLERVIYKLNRRFQLHLLSGDNDSEKENLTRYFEFEHLHFNQSPSSKLNYVKKLGDTHKVIMVGDGLNDAGALLASHCGISITENSTHFSPACDAILEASKFEKLPDFLGYTRACLKTVYWSLVISMLYNVIGLYFAIQGSLQPLIAAILMPLSSASVVLFVTLMSKVWAKKYKLL